MLSHLITAGRLRLILALVVLFHHTLGFFALGASAVYLFFMLSGYWIARLWETQYSTASFAVPRYYFSRWMRLVPILICVLLLAVIAIQCQPGIFPVDSRETYGNFRWWLVTLGIVGIANQPLLIGPAWSLAVEMQFYLLYPLIAWLLTRSKAWFVVLFLVTFCFGTYEFARGTTAITGNVLIFLPYFLAGIHHYLFPVRINERTTVVLAATYFGLLLAFGLVPQTRFIINNYPGKSESMVIVQNLWFFLSTFLLAPVAFVSVDGRSSKFDRMLGNLAYPLYLFHFIPVTFYYYYRDQAAIPKPVLVLLCWVVSAVGTLVIYALVDRPFESLRKFITDRKRLPNHDRKNQKSLPEVGS